MWQRSQIFFLKRMTSRLAVFQEFVYIWQAYTWLICVSGRVVTEMRAPRPSKYLASITQCKCFPHRLVEETVTRENYSHGSLYSAQLLAHFSSLYSVQLLGHWFPVQWIIISATGSLYSGQLLAHFSSLYSVQLLAHLAPCTVDSY